MSDEDFRGSVENSLRFRADPPFFRREFEPRRGCECSTRIISGGKDLGQIVPRGTIWGSELAEKCSTWNITWPRTCS
jgi:hypothetical protein